MFDGTLSHENYNAIRHERERAISGGRRLRELREIEARERAATIAVRTAAPLSDRLPIADGVPETPVA
jgi:hypothetical protein